MADEPSRKPLLEIAPSYLGGIAAIATAIIGVLTFIDGRDKTPEAAPGDQRKTVAENPAPADPARVAVRDAESDAPAVTRQDAERAPGVTESPADGCRRIVGTWQWHTGDVPGVLTFGADRQVGASIVRGAAPVLLGSWSCDAASGAYTIRWQNQVIEHVTLSDDGRTANGSNNLNMPIRGSLSAQ